MSYKKIDFETKLEVIKEFLNKNKVTTIARKYNISRDCVYSWSRAAIEGIKLALEHKNKTPQEQKEIKKLKRENERLRKKIQELSDSISSLSQFSQPLSVKIDRFDPCRPSHCPECGCEIVWKNGTFRIKAKMKDHIIIIQRYICGNPDCKINMYLDEKKILKISQRKSI